MCSESRRRGSLYSDRPKSEWADPPHLKDRGDLEKPRQASDSPPPPRRRSRRQQYSPDSSTGKRPRRRSRSSSSRRSRSRSRHERRRRRSRSRSNSRHGRRHYSSSGYRTKSSSSSSCSDAVETARSGYAAQRERRSSDVSEEEGVEEGYEEEEEECVADEDEFVPRQKMEYYCEVCDVNTTSFIELQTHFGGMKHAKNLKKVGYSGTFRPPHTICDPQLQGEILRCLLCDVILTEAEAGYHVGSSAHIAALQRSEERFRDMDPDKWFVVVTQHSDKTQPGYICKLCEVTLPTFAGYRVHIQGKRHSRALRMAQTVRDSESRSNLQFQCKICNIFCTNQEALDTHLKGKKHLKTLRHKGLISQSEEKTEDKSKSASSGTSSSTISVNPVLAETVRPSKIRCILCDVVLSNSTETQAHLTTTQHYIALRKSSWPPYKNYKDMFVPV